MFLFLFDDPRFHELAQNEENISLLRDTYNVFQWIFCHRFLEEDLIHAFGSPNSIGTVDMDTTMNSVDQYRWASLKIIILTIKKYPHLEESFCLYNSYEKISWETFITVVREIIPNFDSLQFGILLETFFQKDDSPLGARFLFDFRNTDEWFEYMNHLMGQHRRRVSLSSENE